MVQKVKYLSEFSTNMHQTFRTGLFFKVVKMSPKKGYATINTELHIERPPLFAALDCDHKKCAQLLVHAGSVDSD